MSFGAEAIDSAEQYVGPYMQTYFQKITTWRFHHVVAFAVIVWGGLELVVLTLAIVMNRIPRLPVNEKLHLDSFSTRDKLYIAFNKVSSIVFAYHIFLVATLTPTVRWRVTEATFINSVLVLAPMYLLYDFVYTIFHKLLHLRCVYRYVHKHHHRQMSPSRGYYDAINVHPFEFLVGEYLHLLCFCTIPCHIFAIITFIVLASVLATLNHSGRDVSIPGLYDAKDHLVHHRLPDTNFGQYTTFWDKIYGWHCPWSRLAKSA